MAITVTATVSEVQVDLGGIGTLKLKVENDAGTERLVARFNDTRVVDWTPSGGHVEERPLTPLPDGYARV